MKKRLMAISLLLVLLINIFHFVLIIMPIVASPGPPETREVSQAIQLTTDSHYDRDCCFLEDKYGTYWLFFTRGRGDPTTPGYNPDTDFYDIYYLKSTDNGETWIKYSLPSSINDNYGQFECAAFEIASSSQIVVYFTDTFYGAPYGTPTNKIYRTWTFDNGTTWSSVYEIPGVTGKHIDVLWEDSIPCVYVFYESGGLIYVINWTSSGWGTSLQISGSGKHGGIPKAIIDQGGDLNVVWCGWTEGGIYRSTSSDGFTWSTPQLILTSSYTACDPVLVQDSSGDYWLFWAPWDSGTDSQWLEVLGSSDGTTWGNSKHVTSDGYGTNYWWDMWPEAYVESSGDILLFYTSEVTGGGGSGGYSKGDGNIWMFEVVWDLTNNHYQFIQNAIDAASTGDTILVHDGTYNEALFIDKSVTIEAASAPVIKGSQLFATDYGNREAVIFVKDASDVVLEDLDIEGEDLGPEPTKSYGVLYQNSSGTIRNCTVSPNTIGDMYSVGIAAISESNLLIESCTVENFGRIGVYATNVDMIAIYYNEIIGQIYAGAGEVNYGIEIEDYDGASTAEIVGNEIYNSDNTNPSPSWSSAAIIVDIWRMYYDLAPSNVSMEYNEIHDNYLAIEVVSNPSLYAHYNNICNNKYGVFVDHDLYNNNETFDARFNWWGDASGPYHNTNLLGLGNEVGDYVLYSPWFGFVTGMSPMTYHVNPTGKIQDAIDDASSGDTIKVYEGTYTEQLIINKSLSLFGDPGPKIVAPDTRNTYTIAESTATWDPIIFAYGGTKSGGAVSGPGTISVIIDGFEIDGGNKAAAAPTRFVGILYRNVNPGVISNNNIHDMYDADEEGDGPQTFGIMIYGDSDVTIDYNEVRDFSRGGIGVSGDAGALPDPIATVESNTVLGNGLEIGSGWWAENGIQTAWGAGGSIIENNVSDCQVNDPYWAATGIMAYDAMDGIDILDNIVEDCDTGIAVISPSYDLVDGNTVTGCTWDGIRLGWPVNNCTVSNNIISDNWAGIGVWDASDNTIENNIIEDNDYGIYMDGDSHNNEILDNDILNNVIDGIHIEPYGGFDPSGTEVHCNTIAGNGACGVNKTGTEIVDATLNWWGESDNSGPYHPTTNPDGTGDRVSDYVDYEPWKMYPVLKVEPPTYTAKRLNETISINVTINDLQELRRVVSLQFRLTYNSTLLQVLNVTEGPFMKQAGGTWFISTVESEGWYGSNVLVGTLIWPDANGQWSTFPSGSGTLATITFKAIHQERGYDRNLGYIKPPLSCNLTLVTTKLRNDEVKPVHHYLEHGCYEILPTNVGDINFDNLVDIDDLIIAGVAFGSYEGHPRWNPEVEITGDGVVDIDDISIIGINYGWYDP